MPYFWSFLPPLIHRLVALSQTKNSIRKGAVFCLRNPSWRTGEMPLRGVKLLRSEILLRRVLDGFHFAFRAAEHFTIRRMISHCEAIFHAVISIFGYTWGKRNVIYSVSTAKNRQASKEGCRFFYRNLSRLVDRWKSEKGIGSHIVNAGMDSFGIVV